MAVRTDDFSFSQLMPDFGEIGSLSYHVGDIGTFLHLAEMVELHDVVGITFLAVGAGSVVFDFPDE